jgi:hypothetical protein
MVWLGNPAVTKASLWGFGVSTVVFFIAQSEVRPLESDRWLMATTGLGCVNTWIFRVA